MPARQKGYQDYITPERARKQWRNFLFYKIVTTGMAGGYDSDIQARTDIKISATELTAA